MTVVINGSTGISGADGSVGTPAFQGTDTNTGIYFPGADTIGLAAGGTQVASIGLGTTLALQGATSQSGLGITFPATQSASSNANTLDDYEEGTWTPTIAGSTVAGTGTYGTQNGAYTKIGNRVFFNAFVSWTAHTGTGNMLLSNLPFATANTDLSYSAITIYMDSAITLAANNVLQMRTTPNSASLLFAQYAAGGGAAATVAVDTNAGVMVMGHYFV